MGRTINTDVRIQMYFSLADLRDDPNSYNQLIRYILRNTSLIVCFIVATKCDAKGDVF